MFNIFKVFSSKTKKEEVDGTGSSDPEANTLVSEPILSFIKSLESEKSRYKMQILDEMYNGFGMRYQVCIIDTSLKNTYLVDLYNDSYGDILRQMHHMDISDIKNHYHQEKGLNPKRIDALRHVKISDLSWISEDEWNILCKILKKKIVRKESAERRKREIKEKIRNNKKRKEFKKMYMQ